VLFLLLFIISGASATAQVHDVHYQGNLTPLNTTPTFDHGYPVVYDREHRIECLLRMVHSFIAWLLRCLAQTGPISRTGP
jgi:hypothetical protein